MPDKEPIRGNKDAENTPLNMFIMKTIFKSYTNLSYAVNY